MEIFKNKFLVKLIATICLVLTLFNFAGTSRVYADDVWGGLLITPIVNLITALGDSIMEVLHKSIQSQGAAIIKVDGTTEWYEKLAAVLAVVVAVVVAVAAIAVIVALTNWAGIVATKVIAGTFVTKIGIGTVAAGGFAGYLAGSWVYEGMVPNDIYLPAFSITAEEIFANRLNLFDVNFFEPKEDDILLLDPYTVTKSWIECNEGIRIYRLDYAKYTGDLEFIDGITSEHSISEIKRENTPIINERYGN